MSEFMWGVRTAKPNRKQAKRMEKICQEEGGYFFHEVNLVEGQSPGINNGRYYGWFSGPNRGNPHDQDMAQRVKDRISAEFGPDA